MSRLDTLPTPALVIDEQVLFRNVHRLAQYARGHGLAVRPHTKTHKSLAIAGIQLKAGAIGLTVAKAGEAAVMRETGADILIAYPPVGRGRIEQIIELARGGTIRVAMDDARAIPPLADLARSAGVTIGVLVDIDVGMHRTGAQTPREALIIAEAVAREKSLRLDGLFFYPGHIGSRGDAQAAQLREVDAILSETLALFAMSGLPAPVVSGGSTPTAYASHLVKNQTEIRPGTYVFNDMNCVNGGFATLDDCAATVIASVVSTAVPGQVVLDAGTKTLTSDRCGPAPESGHGRILEYPDAMIVKLTEEHAQVSVAGLAKAPALGERVRIVPNHICPCINLQDRVWLLGEDGTLQTLSVDARGRLT